MRFGVGGGRLGLHMCSTKFLDRNCFNSVIGTVPKTKGGGIFLNYPVIKLEQCRFLRFVVLKTTLL